MDLNFNLPDTTATTDSPIDNEWDLIDEPRELQEQVDALTHELVCTLRALGL